MSATARTAPLPLRRPTSASPTPTPSIARGATARSSVALPRPAAPSALSSAAVSRRNSSKPASRSPTPSGVSKESLSASLKEETDQKEQLLVLVQNKDQTIGILTTENQNLTSALNAAEARVNELYLEQSRAEAELAQRIDISEKLRTQVRDLEKEKRDLQRRYNEQAGTFEAERQAFYDNEQHLKSRIQSLTDSRRRPELTSTSPELEVEGEPGPEEDQVAEQPLPQSQASPNQEIHDPETEPAAMTSLRLELSTLSTSYASLQSTLVLLQTQLVDLKRVNRELQEENESYMILLREKTLSGQFDVAAQVCGGTSDGEDEEEDENSPNSTDIRSLRSTTKSTLDRVDEELSEDAGGSEPDRELQRHSDFSISRQPSRSSRKRTSSTSSAPRGESLADLPITGPGLDLAAELGRAENKDISDGNIIDEPERPRTGTKKKRSRANTRGRNIPSDEAASVEQGDRSQREFDALRTEVKSLKDANKALTLYASKIIDRIISQEGFEHVLAVDYEKGPPTPLPQSIDFKLPPAQEARARPQSVIVARSISSPMPEAKTLSPITPSQTSRQRRSLSFDWRGFSIFGGPDKKNEPNLRPLTLKPGATSLTGGRKLDNEEDEEDRKERERLNATMKLMGIHPPPKSEVSVTTMPPTPVEKSGLPSTNANRRFSLFGSKSIGSDTSEATPFSSNDYQSGLRTESNLTQEALERAEAENSLAALDAHERLLCAEIARGGHSGFTEISPRKSGKNRNRKSAGGSSGSTVWSAGMSGGGDED